jgi:RNA polymerase sigma-70 factor (ECF subfamily)
MEDSAENLPHEDDLSLDIVRRIQAGDDSGWEDLYLTYRDSLLFSIRCRLGARLRAHVASEDILHSVVKDALGELQRFEHRGPGALRHYLHACVLNKIRNKAAYHDALKRGGAVPLSDSLAARIPSARAGALVYRDAERYERLEAGLARLPEPMREVVLLRLVEGLSNAEAAVVLGKSVEATSKSFHRALARLGSLVGEAPRDGAREAER